MPGLVGGASAPTVLVVLPTRILAGLLLFVGVMHPTPDSRVAHQAGLVTALFVGAVSALTGNITVGVVAGLLVVGILAIARLGRAVRPTPRRPD